MNIKILHIPTGEIFSTSNSISQTIDTIQQELDLVLQYVVAPLTDTVRVADLRIILEAGFSSMGLEYPLNGSWVDDFVEFLNDLNYYQRDSCGEIIWESISKAEFELLFVTES